MRISVARQDITVVNAIDAQQTPSATGLPLGYTPLIVATARNWNSAGATPRSAASHAAPREHVVIELVLVPAG